MGFCIILQTVQLSEARLNKVVYGYTGINDGHWNSHGFSTMVDGSCQLHHMVLRKCSE